MKQIIYSCTNNGSKEWAISFSVAAVLLVQSNKLEHVPLAHFSVMTEASVIVLIITYSTWSILSKLCFYFSKKALMFLEINSFN